MEFALNRFVAAAALLCVGTAVHAATGNTSTATTPKAQAVTALIQPTYETLVQQLYYAYLGRPAEPAGRDFYVNALRSINAPTTLFGLYQAYPTNPSVRNIVDSLANSAESRQLFPSDNLDTFIDSIYVNAFNHIADAPGKTFWINSINSGATTRSSAALNIIAGVQGSDGTTVDAKTAVAVNFATALDTPAKVAAYTGTAANINARQMLANVAINTDVNRFQSTINTTIQRLNDLSATPYAATTAKAYLGAVDVFTVTNSGTWVYGAAGGDEVVTIANGTTGIVLDQHIERVQFPLALNAYTFRQTGNKITVYNSTGATLIATATVQGDADGTVLSFSNGKASVFVSAGGMTVGGAAVSSSVATPLNASLTANTAPQNVPTKASVYLNAGDSFSANNSGAKLYGNTGNQRVFVNAGASGLVIDQSVERIALIGPSYTYRFLQTGNRINVYDLYGSLLLVSAPVQADINGTILSFSDGVASAILTTGVLKLGGATVSSSVPTALNITLVSDLTD